MTIGIIPNITFQDFVKKNFVKIFKSDTICVTVEVHILYTGLCNIFIGRSSFSYFVGFHSIKVFELSGHVVFFSASHSSFLRQ